MQLACFQHLKKQAHASLAMFTGGMWRTTVLLWILWFVYKCTYVYMYIYYNCMPYVCNCHKSEQAHQVIYHYQLSCHLARATLCSSININLACCVSIFTWTWIPTPYIGVRLVTTLNPYSIFTKGYLWSKYIADQNSGTSLELKRLHFHLTYLKNQIKLRDETLQTDSYL